MEGKLKHSQQPRQTSRENRSKIPPFNHKPYKIILPIHSVRKGGEDSLTILIHKPFLNFAQKGESFRSFIIVFGDAHKDDAFFADVVEQVRPV